MTISIGFICKGGIVLAADTQASSSGTTHKHNNADKLVEFNFRNADMVCVMAGGLDYFEAFRELMARRAAATKVTSQRSIPDAIGKAISELKNGLRKAALPEQRIADRWDRIFDACGFDLLVAFYFKGNPYLYSASFDTGKVQEVSDDYKMVGMPHVLTDYIMDGVRPFDLTNTEGMALATYVVQMAKDHDQSCGGLTRIALIRSACPWILAQDEIAPFVVAASSFEATNKKTWLASLDRSLPPTTSKIYDGDILTLMRPAVPVRPSSEPRPPSPKRGRKRPPASRA